MLSRKEEERNERIIRGLLKLPPNRRCINCDSLGPQYVCTNFWTFVCTTCSGIHREFTHRVKSVSMAKFSKQEVEALQRGGNQRAREIFLQGWDIQNKRLPNSSNIDKTREFIKTVYVEKKYARGTSFDKPPRDVQNNRNFGEDRKASSYHSYSQSPPYDHQYEDRRYGKPSGILTRRTGSDRLHYDGKFAGITYSPGHIGEHMYEDRFADDGSGSRYSDYSVSSVGETSRHDVRSPKFQDSGYNSPSVGNISFGDNNPMRDLDKIPRSQRTTSSNCDSVNPLSLSSIKSDYLADMKLTSEHHSGSQMETTGPPSMVQSTDQTHADKQDLFGFHSVNSVPPSTNSAPKFIDLFAEINQPSLTTFSDHNQVEISPSKNEGWASFDLPQHAAPCFEAKNASSNIPLNKAVTVNFVSFSSETNNSSCPSVQSFTSQQHESSANDQWNRASLEANKSIIQSSSEFRNPFDDCPGNSAQNLTGSFSSKINLQVAADESHSFPDTYSGLKLTEASSKYDLQQMTVDSGLPVEHVSSVDGITGPANTSAVFHNMGSHPRKSVNPFDFPCEPEPGPADMMDMNVLNTALPNPPFHGTFSSNISQPYFPQNSLPQYMTTASSGGLSYVASQTPNTHLTNLSPVGGNPFA